MFKSGSNPAVQLIEAQKYVIRGLLFFLMAYSSIRCGQKHAVGHWTNNMTVNSNFKKR